MKINKEFYDKWTQEEINEYIEQFNIIVLFVLDNTFKDVDVVVHGKNMLDLQKEELKLLVRTFFGGNTMSKQLCTKINEFAEKWYNRVVLKKKARVINYGKKK